MAVGAVKQVFVGESDHSVTFFGVLGKDFMEVTRDGFWAAELEDSLGGALHKSFV